MDRAQKRLRAEGGADEPPPGVSFVVAAQGGDGTILTYSRRTWQKCLGEEHTVGDVKAALSRQAEMYTDAHQLYVVNDKRDGIEETGGELEDDELLGAVIHYNPIFYSAKRLELVVTNFELEEWEILVKLRDGTGYVGWSNKKEGWDTLEEHKDPSQCSRIEVDASGKITKILLYGSNLTGKKSLF